ncbi:MAG: hypothetical protein J6X84_00015 [Treponema sp.]|nr:hypothetical protein [Treponema sp.]
MFEDVEEIVPKDAADKPLKFYYNREERIKKAPLLVQQYYNGELKPVRGFRIFFTKQNRYIFFALIFFIAATWIYTGLNKTRAGATVAGINFELSAFSYEEEVYVSILMKRSKKSKETAPVLVTADFFAIDPNNQVGEKKVLQKIYDSKESGNSDNLGNSAEQYLRTKFTDYDIIRVDVILNVGGAEKELSAEVKR